MEGERKKTITAHITRLKTFPLISFTLCLSFLPSLPVSPSFSSTLLISLLPLFLLLAHYSSVSPFYITPRVSSLVFVCLNRYTSVFPCSACLFLFFDDSLPSCSSPSIPSPPIQSHYHYFSFTSVSFPHPGFLSLLCPLIAPSLAGCAQ